MSILIRKYKAPNWYLYALKVSSVYTVLFYPDKGQLIITENSHPMQERMQ